MKVYEGLDSHGPAMSHRQFTITLPVVTTELLVFIAHPL